MNHRLIPIIICFCFACSVNGNKTIHHPTDENIARQEDFFREISSLNDSLLKQKSSLLKKINSTVNNPMSGSNLSEESLFGHIKSIQKDHLDRTYILDNRQQLIQVFDDKGNFIKNLGRFGQGPGEFTRINSMAISNEKKLYVSNGYRIEVFDISGDEIEYEKSKTFDKSIRSLCILGDQIYLNFIQLFEPDENQVLSNPLDSNLIHVFNITDFRYQESFGKIYKSNNPMVVDRLSVGELSCNSASKVVLFTFERFEIIRGYNSESGELIWETYFNNLFFFNVIEEYDNTIPKISYRRPEGNKVDIFLHPITLEEQYQLIQVDRRIIPENEGYNFEGKVISYILDTSTGEASLIEQDFPKIKYISAEEIITISEDYTIPRFYSLN